MTFQCHRQSCWRTPVDGQLIRVNEVTVNEQMTFYPPELLWPFEFSGVRKQKTGETMMHT